MSIESHPKPNTGEVVDNLEKSNSLLCKDGFCFLPGSEENKNLENKDINIFDPV